MNCEECREQVFELLERHATDPAGVEEVLARCPECRALFDRMKEALETAGELPLEAPPKALDQAVLRAAAARNAEVVPIRAKRRFITPPWAAAAVALLAVGVGLWAIPRGEPPAETPASAPAEQVAFGVEESAPDLEAAEPVAEVARPIAPAPMAEVPAANERQRSARGGSALKASPQRAERTDARSVAVAADAEVASKKERAEMSAECKARVAAHEAAVDEDEADDSKSAALAEDALALGRCYADVGDVEQARVHLQRAAEHPDTKRRALRALRALAER